MNRENQTNYERSDGSMTSFVEARPASASERLVHLVEFLRSKGGVVTFAEMAKEFDLRAAGLARDDDFVDALSLGVREGRIDVCYGGNGLQLLEETA